MVLKGRSNFQIPLGERVNGSGEFSRFWQPNLHAPHKPIDTDKTCQDRAAEHQCGIYGDHVGQPYPGGELAHVGQQSLVMIVSSMKKANTPMVASVTRRPRHMV